MTVIYRPITQKDVPALMTLIRELAVYEKLESMLVATESDLKTLLFGQNAHAYCLLAEMDDEIVGFCAYYYTFSTFQGQYGLYIHDVYVRQQYRSHGIGKGFFQEMARKAKAENCGRIEWSVLDWNTPAIAFYDKIGAQPQKEWIGYRLEGNAIGSVAELKDKTKAA